MMTELEACNRAAEMLKMLGFEHKNTSLRSEAAYYALPGVDDVIRVASHSAKIGRTFGLLRVLACITITPELAKKWGEVHIQNHVASAVGFYLMRRSGIAVPLTKKQRWEKRQRERLAAA